MDKVLKEFEEFLLANIPKKQSFHPHFCDALSLMFKAGGKRFRPFLLLSVVRAYEPLLIKNAFYPALAVEMIHTYSLIHDDLPTFDNAPLRRGQKTLHIVYDEVTATLVGDGLNTEAFGIIAKAPLHNDVKIDLISELVKGSGVNGMVLGQAIDCFFENQKLSLEKLIFLHNHKTAALIASSLKMGGIVANLETSLLNILEEIGYKIGLLFQIQDDIIDATKSDLEAGKPTNHDKNKNSFVNLLGLKKAEEKKESLKQEINLLLDKIDPSLKDQLQKIIEKFL